MRFAPATWNEGGLRLCHACHAKCRGVPGVTGDQASPSAPPSAMSATPATRNDGGCEIVPRLPRETKVDVRLCHACHAKCRGVPGVTGDQASPSAPPSAMSATPATRNDGGCEIVCVWVCVKLLYVKFVCVWSYCMWGRPSQSKRATQCHECHACHAKRWWIWDCATPATWNEGGLRLCHACHAKCRGVPGVTGDQASPSAPPSAMSATPATRNDGGCEIVCVWVCVKLLYVKFVCVWSYCMWEIGMWQSCVCECVWRYCMWSYSMWQMVCDKVVCVCVSVCEVIVC